MDWQTAVTVTAGVIAAGGLLGFGGYQLFSMFGSSARKAAALKRDMRTAWKVVLLGGPLPKGLGLEDKIKYGVIISTDEMLAQTQTLLFCPLINGIDEESGAGLAILPWHVPVDIRQDPDKHYAHVGFARKFVSTKIVLPIGANEVDMDGLERGYLDDRSQIAVAAKLSHWMPRFAQIAHKR